MGMTQSAIPNDEIRVSVAASSPKYLYPLSRRTVTLMCQRGVFKTAHKKGSGGRSSTWFVSAAEVIQHKLNQHASLTY
jgi:hypothetical protein